MLLELDSLPTGGNGAALMEAWRWFQNQPGTGAALVVGNGASQEITARLGSLGAAHGLRVPVDLIHVGPGAEARFAQEGWSCIPSGLDERPSARDELLAGLREVPEVSWSGLGTVEDRDAFLGSTVHWCELPLRLGGPAGVELAGISDDRELDIENFLGELAQGGKGVRIELREGDRLPGRAVRMLDQLSFPRIETRLLVSVDELGLDGVRGLAASLRGASVECAVDYLRPLLAADPDQARAIVGSLSEAGVARLSVSGDLPELEATLDRLESFGADVDVRDVRSLEQLLGLVRRGLRSVGTDFGLADRVATRESVDAAMGQAPPIARWRPNGRRSGRRPGGSRPLLQG